MAEIHKHYTRRELLQKLGHDEGFDEASPSLGFPRRPKNLPRNVAKEYNRVAAELYQRGLLWTWAHDAQVILNYVLASTIEKKREIAHEFACRIPGEDPRQQIHKQRQAAEYWKHISADDLKRLYLTAEEAAALADWVKHPPKAVAGSPEEIEASIQKAKQNNVSGTPGIPPVPQDVEPTVRALWKTLAVALLFGDFELDGELQQALRAEGGQQFFVTKLLESLPDLQKGLRPRV